MSFMTGEQEKTGAKLRVAFISMYYPTYRAGVFRTLHDEHGLAVTMMGAIDDRSGLPIIQSGEVPCTVEQVTERRLSLPLIGKTLRFKPAMVREVLAGKYDVYVLSSALSQLDVWLCLILGKLLGRHICLWGHGYSPGEGTVGRSLRRVMMGLASAHVFYSVYQRDCWLSRGVPPSKLFVAPNALDTEDSERIRAQITFEELETFQRTHNLSGKRTVVFVGRLAKTEPGDPLSKRPDLLVRSFCRVVREVPNAHLVMIGDGPLLDELKRLVSELGLSDYVTLPGRIFDERQIAFYLLSAQLAAMPGWAGLFINHVFDYGLPVVIGKLTVSPPETALVEDGVNGVISSADSPEVFGAALVSLLQDPKRCAVMGGAARDLIRTTYNVHAMAAGLNSAIQAASRKK
jgi:glycosyltransferase involved in cell wall biosynthesis